MLAKACPSLQGRLAAFLLLVAESIPGASSFASAPGLALLGGRVLDRRQSSGPRRVPFSTLLVGTGNLADAVTEELHRTDGWPFLTEGVAEDVAFVADFTECCGAGKYSALGAAWRSQLLEDVADARCTVLGVTQLAPGEVRVRYSLSWVPPTARGLASLGDAWPFVRVEYVDLLDRVRERSVFRWRNVVRLGPIPPARPRTRSPAAQRDAHPRCTAESFARPRRRAC
jgi:hypothetical protein